MLLVWWLDLPKCDSHGRPYQVLELFAGVGRIAAIAKRFGFSSAAVDIEYGKDVGKRMGKRSPMDLNSNAGLVLPICSKVNAKIVVSCWQLAPHTELGDIATMVSRAFN